MNGQADEISLINAALARLGEATIVSLDEETSLAGLAARLYGDCVDAVLSRHSWQHLRVTAPLQLRAETPVNGWRHAFDPPPDALTPPLKLLTDPRRPDSVLRDFALEGVIVYCDRAALWGVYGRRLSPSLWTPALRLTMTVALAADLAIPVCEDKELAQMLRAEAFGPPSLGGQGGLFAQAIASDAAAAPQHAPLLETPVNAPGLAVDWYRG